MFHLSCDVGFSTAAKDKVGRFGNQTLNKKKAKFWGGRGMGDKVCDKVKLLGYFAEGRSVLLHMIYKDTSLKKE